MEINTQPGSSNVCRLALERREVTHNGKACRSHLPTCVERPSPAGRSRVLPDLQRASRERSAEARRPLAFSKSPSPCKVWKVADTFGLYFQSNVVV